ncbi:MAG: glycosyltransferase family 2 protein [Phycisphaerales bacterium]
MRTLVAIPTYNEERYVERVLTETLKHANHVLVVDDGSTDSTPCLLPRFPVEVIRHATNRGYGRSLQDAFRWAAVDGYDWVITMDCDEQHEPAAIPRFLEAIREDDADVISGSRYLKTYTGDDAPPEQRRAINREVTAELNERLGLNLTDAFCGYKAYRVSALDKIELDVDGYAMPLQFWVRAVAAGLRVREIPVRLIYNDPNRTFGGPLDDPQVRIAHYRKVLHCELQKFAERLPPKALNGVPAHAGCSDA